MKYAKQPKRAKKTVTELLTVKDVLRMNKEHRRLVKKGEYTSPLIEKLEKRIDRRTT